MLHFEGDKEFPRTPSELTQRLGDARFLASCIPGVEQIMQAEARQAVCRLRPGFSFVRGTLEVTLRVLDVEPEQSIRYHVHGKGIGSSNEIEAALTLSPATTGTRLRWTADLTQLGGLLKAVPKGLLQAAAQKVIADVWAQVEARLAAGPVGSEQ